MPLSGRHATHLITDSPSSSTVQFTVSSAPQDATKLAIALRWLRLILTFVLAAFWIFISILQIDDTVQLDLIIKTGRIHAIQQWWIRLTTATDWGKGAWVVVTVLLSSTFLWTLIRRDYVEESLLLIRSLGVQTSTSSAYYLSSPTTRFIPATQIQDIFIHEAFRGFEVRFYLAIVVKEEDDAVVVFPKLLPRRNQLEVVWRGARQVLWSKGVQSKSE